MMILEHKWIEWFFSGIGTYFVQLIIGFLCFLFVFIFIKKKRSDKKHIHGDSFNVKQRGFFNTINLNNKSKK